MLGFVQFDHQDITLIVVATIGGSATFGVGCMTYFATRKNRAQLKTGNGHTAGEALDRIEDQVSRLDDRVDRLEVWHGESLALINDINEAVNGKDDGMQSIASEVSDLHAQMKEDQNG